MLNLLSFEHLTTKHEQFSKLEHFPVIDIISSTTVYHFMYSDTDGNPTAGWKNIADYSC